MEKQKRMGYKKLKKKNIYEIEYILMSINSDNNDYEEEMYSVFGTVIETADNEIIMRGLGKMSNLEVLMSEYHVWGKLQEEEIGYYDTEQEEQEETERINRENERKREVREAIRERIDELMS